MIEAKRKFDTEANSYAEKNCGIFIGDIVEITGYAHRGKMMRVTSFSLAYDNWKSEYWAVINGVVLKKDGTDSMNSAQSKISLGKV